MILRGEQRSIRVPMLAKAPTAADRTELQMQIFRTNSAGEWLLLGEPTLNATLDERFAVAVTGDDGAGCALEGTITLVEDGDCPSDAEL
jgi:hypothetical protein